MALEGAPDEAQTVQFEKDSLLVLGTLGIWTLDLATPGIDARDNGLYKVEMERDKHWCRVTIKPGSPFYESGVSSFVTELRDAVADGATRHRATDLS